MNSTNDTNIYSLKQLLLLVYYISKMQLGDDDTPIYPSILKMLRSIKYQFHDFNLCKNQYINGSLSENDISFDLSVMSKKHNYGYNLRGGLLHNPIAFFPLLCRTNISVSGNNVYLSVGNNEHQRMVTYYTSNKFRGSNQAGQNALLHYLYRIQIPSFCDRIIFPLTSWNFNTQLMR
jgi:hypothetical protein